MGGLRQLLDLQDLDVQLEQLVHKRGHLPERAELVEVKAAVAQLDAGTKPVAVERAGYAAEQKRLEDDAARIAAKIDSEDKRLYSGTVTSPRELQSITEEIASLKRRRSDLDDRAIEQLVMIEPLDDTLAQAATKREALGARGRALNAAIAAVEVDIDGEIARVGAGRAPIVAELDAVSAQIAKQYEAMRGRMGGVAVAKLEAGSCNGCHIKLSSVHLDRVLHEPPDVIVHCEQCGRILIR